MSMINLDWILQQSGDVRGDTRTYRLRSAVMPAVSDEPAGGLRQGGISESMPCIEALSAHGMIEYELLRRPRG